MKNGIQFEKYIDHDVPTFDEMTDTEHWAFEASPLEWGDVRYHFEFDGQIADLILTHAPEGIRDSVKNAILMNYMSSKARLIQNNNEAYLDMLSRSQGTFGSDQLEVLDKAKAGFASPNELFRLMKETDLVSLELAKLTHPYGIRMQHAPVMYERIADVLEENFEPEQLFPEEPTIIRFFPHDLATDHFIFTTKDIVASNDTLTVIERRAFALQIDEKLGFDSAIRAKIERLSSLINNKESKTGYKKWKKNTIVVSGLQKRIMHDLEQDNLPDYILPVSTVFYTYRQGQKVDKQASRNVLSNHYPATDE